MWDWAMVAVIAYVRGGEEAVLVLICTCMLNDDSITDY